MGPTYNFDGSTQDRLTQHQSEAGQVIVSFGSPMPVAYAQCPLLAVIAGHFGQANAIVRKPTQPSELVFDTESRWMDARLSSTVVWTMVSSFFGNRAHGRGCKGERRKLAPGSLRKTSNTEASNPDRTEGTA